MVRVPMWEYLWGHTAAQIELMTVDAPFVAYQKREKSKEEKMKSYTREKAKRDYDKWVEKKKKRKTNLSTFLGNGKLDKAKPVAGGGNK